MMRNKKWRRAMVSLVATMAVVLTACSGGEDGEETESPAAEQDDGASGDDDGDQTAEDQESDGDQSASGALDEFEAEVERIVAEGTQEQLYPLPDGPEAASDKKVFVIACILAAEGCARGSRASVEAGEMLGWEMTLIDTGSEPPKMEAAVQRAINESADGIIFEAIDAGIIAGVLQQAKDAGIPMVCANCINQDDLYDQVLPSEDSFYDDGYAMAAAMYHFTDGEPRLLMFVDDEFGVAKNRRLGTEQFIKNCQAAGGACEILAQENFLVQELVTRVPGLAASTARANPDFNAVWSVFDSGASFIQQGLRDAGFEDPSRSRLYGFDGNAENLEALRSDGYQILSLGLPMELQGWARVDALNRIFQGEELVPADEVVKSKMLTADNVPAEGSWPADIDFRSHYRDIWGLE